MDAPDFPRPGLTRVLCLHLGAVVPTEEARQRFACEKGRGNVRPCCDCGPERCPDYEADV